MKLTRTKLSVGDWVEVRTKDEILRTLDSKGQLDGMPFMPEMLAFCGKKFPVYKRAHKTCDTVFPIRSRRVHRAVHLETRCDGSAHGGCQAGCLVFWKEAWLKPIAPPSKGDVTLRADQQPEHGGGPSSGCGCTEANVWAPARTVPPDGVPSYVCQATQLPYATTDLDWWDLRQYVEDYRSGNVGLWRIICGGVFVLYYWLTQAGIGVGRPMRWFYDNFYPLWRGAPFPRRNGIIPEGEPTPAETLDLRPGELVRIKPYKEILKSLNTGNRNRGLYVSAEEVPYCGGTYRVLRRVERIIDERTGRMLEMKTPCIVLDSVVCEARYSECRLFCPRSIYSYWREMWLERMESPVSEIQPKERQVVSQC